MIFPKRDLKVAVRRIIPVVGEQEITEFPTFVPAGGTMGIKVINVEKIFPANQVVVLDPEDGRDLIFTLRHIIALSIFQWYIDSGEPKPP